MSERQAAWKDTQLLGDGDANKRGGFGNEVMLSVPCRSDKAGLTAQGAFHGGCVGSIPPSVTQPVLKPGPASRPAPHDVQSAVAMFGRRTLAGPLAMNDCTPPAAALGQGTTAAGNYA